MSKVDPTPELGLTAEEARYQVLLTVGVVNVLLTLVVGLAVVLLR